MNNNTITRIGYKLFEMNSKGNLFPLFIDKGNEVPVGEWIHAKYVPTKGFSPRGGWHLGADVPDAPWLKGYTGTPEGAYKSRFRNGKRVWAECVYNASIDYNEEVMTLKGKCFKDHIPENGYYFFREAGKGVWVITSDIFVTRLIDEEERKEIMLQKGYDEIEAFSDYNRRLAKRARKQKRKGNKLETFNDFIDFE